MSAPGDTHAAYDDALAHHYDEDYEILRAGAADVAFYREAARAHGGAVLEVGCGTGRVLLPLARAGLTVTGVDPSTAMLAELERKLADEPPAVRERVTTHRGTFAELPVDGPFDFVYSAFRCFQHLETRADRLAALRELRRVLAPHGTLAFDLFDFSPEKAAAYVDERTDYRLEDGDVVRERRASSHVEPDGRAVRGRFRWLEDGVETDRAEFTLAIVPRDELIALLEESGLRLRALLADFEGAAWSADDPRELVVLAGRDDAHDA